MTAMTAMTAMTMKRPLTGLLLLLAASLCLAAIGCEPKKEPVGEKTAEGEAAETANAEGEAAGAAPGTNNTEDDNTEGTEPAGGDDGAEGDAGADEGVDWAAVLKDPKLATHQAPETFRVEMQTSEGPVVLELYREWSPRGVDRVYNLVKSGYFTDLAVFRMVDGFVAQFGMHGTPDINAVWSEANITDDPVTHSNEKGTIVFAMAGPDTRSTQFFINLVNNKRLDAMGFSPLGKVVEGMENVEKFHSGYGDGPPRGTGPDQGKIHEEGNAYLKREFPELDYIQSAKVVTGN